jgi:two-component system, chemotaxis family, protein-glutamate methylesterase/glutaminase
MIKVIVTDDSAFMRKILSDIINSDPELEVVATAKDGQDLLDKIPEFNPDVITLDISMPNVDGVTALRRIMKEHPLPVIMVSALSDEEYTFTCLEIGAVDFIPKTSGIISIDMSKKKDIILQKIKTAAKAKIHPDSEQIWATVKKCSYKQDYLIVIGASTGGPRIIESILTSLPEDFSVPVIIVQHMPQEFTSVFAKRLDSSCSFNVKEAEEGDIIRGGTVLVAPGNLNLTFEKQNGSIVCRFGSPKENNLSPCIDVTMKSAAELLRDHVLGIVLSGMGNDGTQGLVEIKKYNGYTFVQDEASCAVAAMPKSAIDAGVVDKIIPVSSMVKEIMQIVEA